MYLLTFLWLNSMLSWGFFKLVTDTGQTKAGTKDCRLSDSPSAAVEEGRISNESSGM